MTTRSLTVCIVVLCVTTVWGEYRPTPHKPLAPGAIPVTEPGNLDRPGATYQLMRDVTSDRTALFLAKDVTLDLNGYTLTYAAGDWPHVPNGDFEKDFEGFDVSKAPNAKVKTIGSDWPFTGKKVCFLPKGEEIVSSCVNLPLADRSYYAMVAVYSDTAPVTISVEDAAGEPVTYEHHVGTKVYKNCPISAASKLDGGCVYAHFRGKPAGKYRVRVKAGNEDLHIDHVDIRPALDAGVVLADTGWVYANYSQVAWGGHTPVLVDYLAEGSYNRLADDVTTAKGNAGAVIRNGIIRNGTRGMHSWGIVAKTTGTVTLENVKMVAAGINTQQALFWGAKAIVRDCRFETDTPFIIERHNVINSPVSVSVEGSEVSHCTFIGGQGNLHVRGKGIKVHDNLFVNRQRVTNHYSLTLSGAENVEVYNNRFEPEIGCSINMFRSKSCTVRNNTFNVNASGWSCAVYRGAGTITGVRVTDYNAAKGDPRGCSGNRVHDNVFTVRSREYRTWGKTLGRATAIFYSSGGGENFFTNNKIDVRFEGTGGHDALGAAYYIGAASHGGRFIGNTITSNVPACRIAAGYGPAGDVLIEKNTFIKAPDAPESWKPVRIGYWTLTATDIAFKSNRTVGGNFDIEWSGYPPKDKPHTWSVWWTLTVKAPAGAEVVVADKEGNQALKATVGPEGVMTTELPEYRGVATWTGREYDFRKTYASPYTVKVGGREQKVTLEGDTEVAF